MKTLRVRFAVMLATAAVVPLLTYGAVSVYSLREGIQRTVVDGNLNVAQQVGGQVHRYVSTNLQILQALGAELESADLTLDQKTRILNNYVLRVPEFRKLAIVDEAGRPLTRSGLDQTTVTLPPDDGPSVFGARMSPVYVDNDLLPTSLVAVRLGRGKRQSGWLVGEFSIEELWRLVGRIRVGSRGVVLLVGPGGELLAHGNPDERSRVARGTNMSADPVVAALRASADRITEVQEVRRENGDVMLAVGARVADLNWLVIVEQPAFEAYAVARRHERDLLAAISLALLIMVLAGVVWGRSLIVPIAALIRGTEAIAEGRLGERVAVESPAEMATLGDAFNRMADHLVELQENVRRQERHAMFGRVASGLVHDLSHPFMNIQNNCRLILLMHADADYREMFKGMIEREFSHIKRVFEDLRNIARPMPMERFPLDVNKLLVEVAESMRSSAETAGVSLELDLADEPLFVEGDVFALSRVTRNLVTNAIEATPLRGSVAMTSEVVDGRVRMRVVDTGCGIPPERVATLFEDFATTKRQGLGLGLAISKKIVEQLGGTISVTSAPGQGTGIAVELTRVSPPAATV